MSFYLVTTDHLSTALWFKDEKDFIQGMNVAAIISATSNVQILCFILMSNHVHFVLAGSREEAEAFMVRYKKIYSQYYNHKYKSKEFLRRVRIDVQELTVEDESLHRAIAYVQMNSVGANICLMPADYPWGTGSAFFKSQSPKGTPVGTFSQARLRRYIGSKIPLPEKYILNERGFIDPSSYVNVDMVENLFRTPKRMLYFLQSSSKAKRLHEAPTFNDQLLVSVVHDLCTSLYRERDLKNLPPHIQADILKQIRYRFSADPAQISRVTGLPYNSVCHLLETL